MLTLNSYRVGFARTVVGATMLLMPAIAAHAGPTSASLVFEAPTLSAAPGSSGSFDIVIANPSLSSFHLAGESVELGISGTGVEFTNTGANTLTPYVFSPSFDLDNGFTLDASGNPYPKNDFITSDVSDAPAGFVVVSPGETLGIVHVSYTVDPGATLGPRTLTIEDLGGGTSTSDEFGNVVPFTASNGSLTVAAVPEPACLGLMLVLAPLLGRRRRAAI
jgi:hypothetical protein